MDRIYIYLIYWYLVRSLGQGFYNCLSFCSQGRVCIPACNGQGMCIPACNGAGRCLPGVSTQGVVCLGGVCLSARGVSAQGVSAQGVSAQGVSAGGCLPPPHRDGHWSGQYATYWNAFLFHVFYELYSGWQWETFFGCGQRFQCIGGIKLIIAMHSFQCFIFSYQVIGMVKIAKWNFPTKYRKKILHKKF